MQQRDPAGHYAVLNVDQAAPPAAITAAYRRRAKLLHPDNPATGDAEAFLRLRAAYQILGDPTRRAAYDQAAATPGAAAAKRPAWRQEATELAFTPALSWRPPRFAGLALALITLLSLAQVAHILLRPTPSARQTACLGQTGPPLRGGEFLVRRGSGPVRVRVENREDQPALFKLRVDEGMVVAAVYLAPHGSVTIADFPVGIYRAEFALGDRWSQACGLFLAGMRARRFAAALAFSGTMQFVLPPPDTPTTAISTETFSRE